MTHQELLNELLSDYRQHRSFFNIYSPQDITRATVYLNDPERVNSPVTLKAAVALCLIMSGDLSQWDTLARPSIVLQVFCRAINTLRFELILIRPNEHLRHWDLLDLHYFLVQPLYGSELMLAESMFTGNGRDIHEKLKLSCLRDSDNFDERAVSRLIYRLDANNVFSLSDILKIRSLKTTVERINAIRAYDLPVEARAEILTPPEVAVIIEPPRL